MDKKYMIPLGIVIAIFVVLGIGLVLNPTLIDSPLVNKPAPEFSLPTLHEDKKFSPKDMLGKVWLLNVWASWCLSCRQEHPLFMKISKEGINIYGLNYKDRPSEAKKWLNKYGNPYKVSVKDIKGKVGIEFGVYGVPETFIIDKKGVIRYKVVGPLSSEEYQNKVLPLIKKLEG